MLEADRYLPEGVSNPGLLLGIYDQPHVHVDPQVTMLTLLDSNLMLIRSIFLHFQQITVSDGRAFYSNTLNRSSISPLLHDLNNSPGMALLEVPEDSSIPFSVPLLTQSAPGLADKRPVLYRRPSNQEAIGDAVPILVDDTYHLFHLTTPAHFANSVDCLRSSWSHVRSTDLLEWVRDPNPAVSPGEIRADLEAEGASCGTAILGPDEKMHIFYTGHNSSREKGMQVINHAYSIGRHGTSFVKSQKSIIIDSDAPSMAAFEKADFTGPFVFWNAQEKQYWMLLATRLASGPHWTKGCISLLTSQDLSSWTFHPEPLFAPNDMFCPESPELFTLASTGKWYLVYSRFSSPCAGTVYRMADSPWGPFRIPRDGSNGRLDGRRWYAAKSCSKAGDPSKRIYFGWIADRSKVTGKWMWGGDMSVREVSTNHNGTLRIELVEGMFDKIFTRDSVFNQGKECFKSVGTMTTKFLDFKPSSKDTPYLLTIEMGTIDASSFGFLFRMDDDLKGYCMRCAETAEDKYSILLSAVPSPLDDFWAEFLKVDIPREVDGPQLVRRDNVSLAEGPIKILVIDETIEVFAGGRALSYRLAGGNSMMMKKEGDAEGTASEKSKSVKIHELGLFVDDGNVTFSSMTVHEAR